jgi:hypothetical protein
LGDATGDALISAISWPGLDMFTYMPSHIHGCLNQVPVVVTVMLM